MAVTKLRFANRIALTTFLLTSVALLTEATWPNQATAGKPLSEGPVIWFDQDDQPIPRPEERNPSLTWDYVDDSILLPRERLTHPIRGIRQISRLFGGERARPAQNVNTLGEAVNSSWFTNRIGIFPMTAEDVARGPGTGLGPSRDEPWTVVSAKTEGVTPGFNIRDSLGDVYVIKFDPKGYLGMTTCAGVVCGRIFHAAGYNVPDDVTVTFRREDLVLGDGVKVKVAGGEKRLMTIDDINEILDSVDQRAPGEWFAISSKFLEGRPVGPFDYKGRRKHDPNDRILHQDRRELRGLDVFCGWLNHFDTKQHNTLDMYVGEDGEGYIKHHLIDFASTLGSGANGPTQRYGYEYTVDFPAVASRLFSLGFYETTWRKVHRPEDLPEVGYFVSDDWGPKGFKPLQPNTSFAHRTDPDGYWAAKIITAFSDAHLEAIVQKAGYRDPRASEYVIRILAERRDQIGREYFDEIAPLEFFSLANGEVRFRDLGAERNIYPSNVPLYQVRAADVDADRNAASWSEWETLESPACPLSKLTFADGGTAGRGPFLAVEARVRRYEGWSDPVTAYIAIRSQRTIAMNR